MSIFYADSSEKVEEQKSIFSEKPSNGSSSCESNDKSESRSPKETIKCERCKKALKPIKQDMKGWARKLHKKCWKEKMEERDYRIFLDVCKPSATNPILYFPVF